MDTKGKDTKDEDEEGEDDGEGVSAILVSACREWPKKYRKAEMEYNMDSISCS